MFGRIAAVAGVCLLVVGVAHVRAQTLKGSRTAMKKQNTIAKQEDYTFLATSADVREFVQKGLLVTVRGNSDYRVADVSFPYARPAVKTFVERLGSQYRDFCGERLVVTSLTRPLSRQPWNAHELSVHPAGMALDLRVPRRSSCRSWLEKTLASLEGKSVIDATKEKRPAHYHIAVYPSAYERYVSNLTVGPKLASAATTKPSAAKSATTSSPKIAKVQGGNASYASMIPVPGATATKASAASTYKVRKGDSLWSIARSHDLTINQLKKANGLKRSTITPGQTLRIPTA